MTATKDLSISELQFVTKQILDYVDCFCREKGISYYLIGGALIGAIREGDLVPWDDDIDIAMMRSDYEVFCNNFVESERYRLCNYKKTQDYRHGASKVVDKTTVFIEEGTRSEDSGVFIDVFPLDSMQKPSASKASLLMAIKKTYLFANVYSRAATKGNLLKQSLRIILSHTLGLMPYQWLLGRIDRYLSSETGDYVINFWGAWDSKECGPLEWFETSVPVTLGDKTYPAPVGYDKWLTRVYGNYMIRPEQTDHFHGRGYIGDQSKEEAL